MVWITYLDTMGWITYLDTMGWITYLDTMGWITYLDTMGWIIHLDTMGWIIHLDTMGWITSGVSGERSESPPPSLENPDRHRVDTRPLRPSEDEVSPEGRQNRSPEVYLTTT